METTQNLNVTIERSDRQPIRGGAKRFMFEVAPNEQITISNHDAFPFAFSRESTPENIIADLVAMYGAQRIGRAIAAAQKKERSA